MQQPTLQVHGSSNNDNVFMVDGVQIQHIGFGGNQTGFYFNDGLMDEISYQTSSLPAEAPVGGVQINMIPRDGGNVFHGGLFATGGNGSLQSNNLTPDLQTLGFKAQNKVKSVYDINGTFGGPIQKDRLWFFGTVRRWSANNYLGNTFASNGSQAVDDQRLTDATIRLTLQASKKNKFSFHYDRSVKWRGHRPNNWLSATLNDPISDVVQTTQLNYIGEIKWSSPISDRLLAEAAMFTMPVNYTLGFEPGAAPGTVATFDQIQSSISGVSPRMDTDSARMFTYSGNVSYVTGSHSLKVGTQVRTGWSQELFTMQRRHAADHEQRRPELGAARQHAERPQGVGREHRRLRAGFVADGSRHAQPGRALRALRHVDSGAERAGRHLGARARFPGAGRHRQLEHRVAAPRRVVGRVRRRPDRAQGRRQPVRSPRGHHDHPAAQPAEHLVRNVSVERRQPRSHRADQ